MTATAGNLALCAAVLAAAGAAGAAAVAARHGSAALLRLARWLVVAIAASLTVAAAALLAALVTSDFSIAYVADYTERALPLGYRIAAFWAGQDGSVLLWAWLLAAACTLAVTGQRRHTGPEHGVATLVMAVICGFFAALLLFATNPFESVAGAVPFDGRGLNPQLQDPAMVIHPPLLFTGYSGFAVPFALLIGVLVAGRRDNRWLSLVRRWVVGSWMFLGAGILLGAWWAYVELGWGGYWAWDPVENASLLPWLTATALMHSMAVQQHRGMFKRWNACLIALTFILCIFGTYLTRSGVIDSVHAFAGGLLGTFFLVFLGLTIAASAALIAWRFRALEPEHELEGVVSREGAFLAGNVLLLTMAATTLTGTVFPLLSAPFAGQPMTVKPSYYNTLVAPMALILVGLMTVSPLLAFGRDAASRIGRNLIVPGVSALVITAAVAVTLTADPWALVCAAMAALGTCAVIADFARALSARRRSTGETVAAGALRLIDRDHRRYGGQLAHLGLMLIVIGVAGSSLFATEQTHHLRPGEVAQTGRYQLTLAGLEEVRGPNFTAMEAVVHLLGADGRLTTLRPQRRFYDTWGDEPNSEVAIHSGVRDDVYVTLAGWGAGGTPASIRIRINPAVLWIWVGGIVLTVGALFCLLPPLLPKRAWAVTAALPRAAVRILLAAALLGLVGADASPTAGIEIHAVQGTPDGPPIGDADVTVSLDHHGVTIDTVKTRLDERGIALVDNLPAGIGARPVVAVSYRGMTFHGAGTPLEAAPARQRIDVVCYEPAVEAPPWRVGMWHVMVDEAPGGHAVTEILVVENPLDRAWGGVPGPDGRPATTVFALPRRAGAVMLQDGFEDWSGATLADDQLVIHEPLLPGQTKFKYSYLVPDTGGVPAIDLVAPGPVDQLLLMGPDDVLADAGGLRHAGSETVGGRTITAFSASNLSTGAAVSVAFGPAAGGSSRAGVLRLARYAAAVGAGALLLAGAAYALRRPGRGAAGAGASP